MIKELRLRSIAYIAAAALVVITNAIGYFIPKLQPAPYSTTLLESPSQTAWCPGDTIPLQLKFEVKRPANVTFFTAWRDVTASRTIVTDTVGVTVPYDRAEVSYVPTRIVVPQAQAGHELRMIKGGSAAGAEDFAWSYTIRIRDDCAVAKTGDK